MKSIFRISVLTWLPLHIVILNAPSIQQTYEYFEDKTKSDSDFRLKNLLIWLPFAIFLPRFIFENYYIVVRPKWRIEKYFVYGIVTMVLSISVYAVVFVFETNSPLYFSLAIIFLALTSLT